MLDDFDEVDLGTVPDSSMLSMFKSVVTFLSSEAQGRGWDEVTERLRHAEAALDSRMSFATNASFILAVK